MEAGDVALASREVGQALEAAAEMRVGPDADLPGEQVPQRGQGEIVTRVDHQGFLPTRLAWRGKRAIQGLDRVPEFAAQ